jgi:hypothetical protein
MKLSGIKWKQMQQKREARGHIVFTLSSKLGQSDKKRVVDQQQ